MLFLCHKIISPTSHLCINMSNMKPVPPYCRWSTIVSIWYLTMRLCRQTSFSGKCFTKFEFFNSVRFSPLSPLCLYVAIVYQFLFLFDYGSLFMLCKVDGVMCYWFYLFTKLFTLLVQQAALKVWAHLQLLVISDSIILVTPSTQV